MSTPILHGILIIVALAAVTDARTGRIPNWITLPPLVVGPVAHGLWGGFAALGISCAAIVICGLIPYLMFRAQAAGGGDVKLLAAVGGLGGVGLGIEAQLFSFAIAAGYSLVLLAWRGKLLRTIGNALFLAANPVLPARYRRTLTPELMSTVRLGIPILAGTLVAIWLRTGAVTP